MHLRVGVVVFCYRRVDHIRKTLESLKEANGIDDLDVIIYCDGARGEHDASDVQRVRDYIASVRLGKTTQREIAPGNLGLKKSIQVGIAKSFETYDALIVLEDDLVVTEDFIKFHLSALSQYKNDDSIFAVSGFAYDFPAPGNYLFKHPRICSWGWSTWAHKWGRISFQKSALELRGFRSALRMLVGGLDLFVMRVKEKRASNSFDSWTPYVNTFIANDRMDCLYPARSFVRNEGELRGIHSDGTVIKERNISSPITAAGAPFQRRVVFSVLFNLKLASHYVRGYARKLRHEAK